MTRRTISVCAALLVGATACVTSDPAPRFQAAWEPFDPTGEGWASTKSIHVVSDCQLHNLYSLPVPERNLSAESAVATAIRSPQLDLFSRDVLQWILRNGAPESDLIVHLGDALDLACEGELESFLEVMDGVGKPWFMAPGNHDCFYFGVYDPEKRSQWQEACYGSGRPLTKDLFLRLYLANLIRRDDPDSAALAASLGLTSFLGLPLGELAERLPPSFDWEQPVGECLLLEGIWWNLDQERPWRSFLMQCVTTGSYEPGSQPTRMLLMDSCQYARRPQLIPNGWRSYPPPLNSGSGGEMLPDQLRLARAWIEARPGGTTLAFHHPFDALAPRSKSSIGWLRRERNVSLVLTAHTHRGYFAHHDLGGESDELELNIGSTTDWPMEWRVLSAKVNVEQEKIYIVADRHTLVDELSNEEGFFLQGWEIPLDAPDDYRRYKKGDAAGSIFFSYYFAFHLTPYWLPQPRVRATKPARETEAQVKDTLLWTYLRLIDMFPTHPGAGEPAWPAECAADVDVVDRIQRIATSESLAEKIDFLIELEAFERSRSTWDPESRESTDEMRAHFKISQAAWASRFENSKGRRLRLEDEVIRIDWEKTMERRERLGLSTAEGQDP